MRDQACFIKDQREPDPQTHQACTDRASRQDLLEESAVAIQQTIRRSALQCYVIEGVYPPNLQSLEENYGLQVNEKDFIIHYEAFASNLPPAVRVMIRQH